MTARERFVVGQRVEMSVRGYYALCNGWRRRASQGHKSVTGTVSGFCRDGACVRVVFDGNVSPTSTHHGFWKPLGAHESIQGVLADFIGDFPSDALKILSERTP